MTTSVKVPSRSESFGLVALEAGAAAVHLFLRRPSLAALPVILTGLRIGFTVALLIDELAYEAMRRMEAGDRPVSVAPALNHEGYCIGMVRIHDFLRAGL